MEKIVQAQNSILYTDELVKRLFEEYTNYNPTFIQELASMGPTPQEKYNQELLDHRGNEQMLTKSPNETNTNPENLYNEEVSDHTGSPQNLIKPNSGYPSKTEPKPEDLYNENFTTHYGVNVDTSIGKYIGESTWLTKANQLMNTYGFSLPFGGNQQPVSDELIIGAVEAVGLTIPAAIAGTNMGQVEGPLYVPPKATIEGRIEGAKHNLAHNGFHMVMGLLSNGSSINPGVSRLVDRLETFNYGASKSAPEQEKYSTKLDPDETNYVKNNWRISAKTGDAQQGDPNIWGLVQGSTTLNQLLFGTGTNTGTEADEINNNVESVDRAWKEEYKKIYGEQPYNKIYQDYAGAKARKYWGNKNIIPSVASDYPNVVGQMKSTNVVRGDSKEAADKINKDQQFVFYFEEVSDTNPSWCIFPASVKPPQESFTPEFTPIGNLFGRPEKPVVYTGTSRTLQFEIQLMVQALEEMEDYKERINWLTQRCYAKYEEGTGINVRLPLYKYPPLIRITLGDLYYRLGGYITSLNVNWGQPADLWEKFLVKKRIPLSCNITLGFTALHDFVPDGNSRFWGWDDINRE